MKKAAKWMSGLGALLMGAAVMGASISVAWAAEDTGAQDDLGSNDEYKTIFSSVLYAFLTSPFDLFAIFFNMSSDIEAGSSRAEV